MNSNQKYRTFDRYPLVRDEVYAAFAQIYNPVLRAFALSHTSMVDAYMSILCKKRNLDPEPGKIAAVLHDIGKFLENQPSRSHARSGADAARKLLAGLDRFTPEEIEEIASAIEVHSNKLNVDSPLAEALKDADCLAGWSSNPGGVIPPERVVRLQNVMQELSIDPDPLEY